MRKKSRRKSANGRKRKKSPRMKKRTKGNLMKRKMPQKTRSPKNQKTSERNPEQRNLTNPKKAETGPMAAIRHRSIPIRAERGDPTGRYRSPLPSAPNLKPESGNLRNSKRTNEPSSDLTENRQAPAPYRIRFANSFLEIPSSTA